MKKNTAHTKLLFYLGLMLSTAADAQTNSYGSSPQKSALTFNIGQLIVNEFSIGYERFFTDKKSVEFNAGLIYRNDFWRKQADEWSNSQYFYERGFTLRVAHKIYRKSAETSRKRTYYSFGLNYQYLYFRDEWFRTDHQPIVYLKDDAGHVIAEALGTEEIYQRRFRNRIGLQFISGNIFPFGKNFAVEIYYGIGLRGVFSNRYDIAVSQSGFGITTIYASGNRDEKFYFRPTIHAGAKFRMAW